jgi:hypothetical protein
MYSCTIMRSAAQVPLDLSLSTYSPSALPGPICEVERVYEYVERFDSHRVLEQGELSMAER